LLWRFGRVAARRMTRRRRGGSSFGRRRIGLMLLALEHVDVHLIELGDLLVALEDVDVALEGGAIDDRREVANDVRTRRRGSRRRSRTFAALHRAFWFPLRLRGDGDDHRGGVTI